ncbi:SufD family Fe-S cluster assembly protein [Rhodococcus sp. KBS0724]|uniref:SufB/SufD family protein n=1 Tax=Rhodococcus sp. KBS0724 TaxID=1179674 RepID=UPI00110EB98F|nr:SufD family Fe-S cluster assembly protein [Rhodococcus sp. KBS0724]TSD40214.1 SufD family Fe-S cluster assembly protein [Rhodococcus sp. KBS0724]
MAALTETRSSRPRTGSPAERFTSRDWTQFPEPQGKDETWRFTPLAKVRALVGPFTPVQLILDDVSIPESATWSIVSSKHSSVGRVLAPTDRASALAWENESSAAVIEIEKDQTLQDPVIVTYRGRPGLTCSHTVVRAAAGSQATVIVEYLGSSTLSENIEIIVEDGAQLTFVTVHNWTDDSIHLATHTCSLGERSTLKHVVVDLGGSLLRTTPSVRLNGPHSSVEMLGVGVAGANQHIEARLYVDHAAPECISNVLYKNVLLSPPPPPPRPPCGSAMCVSDPRPPRPPPTK